MEWDSKLIWYLVKFAAFGMPDNHVGVLSRSSHHMDEMLVAE